MDIDFDFQKLDAELRKLFSQTFMETDMIRIHIGKRTWEIKKK